MLIGCIKLKAIFTVTNEVLPTTALPRNDNGKTTRQRFVYDEAPRLAQTCVDKRAGQPVVEWKCVVLFKSGQEDVAPQVQS